MTRVILMVAATVSAGDTYTIRPELLPGTGIADPFEKEYIVETSGNKTTIKPELFRLE